MEFSELQDLAEQEKKAQKPTRVHCCTSTGCQAAQSLAVKKGMEQAVKDQGLEDDVQIIGVGCMGFCGQGPIVQIDSESSEAADGLYYEKVTPEQAPSIIDGLKGGAVTANQGDPNHPFFSRQFPIVREYSGKIDPESIGEYLAMGGYQSLYHAVYEMSPEEVIAEITKAGLRGRGGAGYPTGLKWATMAKMPSGQKYVICNADEGDPGAFMDRSVLESDPHRILEGMAIAGYAVGANQGYIYVRAEYPLAITRLEKAIRQAKRQGFLGSGILGSSIDFNIAIRVGAGAFVCGEETALIASIDGGRGVPRPRPPYPAVSGLWGEPTLINNVETLGNIAPIIRNGSDWFAGIGTEKSKGTKIFSLTGKVCNNGLIEVPMGITLREIVEVMGGGVPDGGKVKAVQTGGPSGGCIPAEYMDTPVDYDSLTKLGSMMGSGGMVVMDDSTNMVQVAQFYMEFCQEESCGKCIPCRTGTVQMYELLTKVIKGKGTLADLENLENLCQMVRVTSLCGLGMSAPNPVLSTLRYFKSEYEEFLAVKA
ncbi:NuoF family protein [Roseofilum sp. Guam]|uniref:NuoF family protein n=1 Tax=Roseofilum sp. Guam TaxID=2821502 RepID=UPI001B1CCC10|nr:NuoF family protein [Roseofilum sp. Guam]MBP0029186.1 NAD(P)H-dependent oxidoreductase subunit E [Roseofilum sp. Guam]